MDKNGDNVVTKPKSVNILNVLKLTERLLLKKALAKN